MTKHLVWMILGLVVSTLAAHAQTTAAQPISLSEAVAVALKNNPTVQAADAYAEAVERGLAVARAGHFPRLDFTEAFTRGNNPVYVFGTLLTQRRFTAQNFDLAFLNTPTPLDNFRTQLSASVPLYAGGQISRQVKEAQLRRQDAVQAGQRTRQEVIFGVVRAYLNELLARESLKVAQQAVEMANSDLARARTRHEQGLVVLSDVLSAQVQVAQAQQDLIQAENAVSLAEAALNVAMGLPEGSDSQIQGTLGEVTFETAKLEELQSRALTRRPDYLQAGLGKERAANGLGMARAEFLPKLVAFGAWERDSLRFASAGGHNWAAGVSLNFNIFDGGANRARLAEATARRRQAEAQDAALAAGIRLQVREAYLSLNAARQRLEVSREAAAQAQESLRILQDRYEAGLATIADLLRMETAYTAARKNYLHATFDYRLSFAALEFATGELSPDSASVTR